jgi:hypothetical protein
VGKIFIFIFLLPSSFHRLGPITARAAKVTTVGRLSHAVRPIREAPTPIGARPPPPAAAALTSVAEACVEELALCLSDPPRRGLPSPLPLLASRHQWMD